MRLLTAHSGKCDPMALTTEHLRNAIAAIHAGIGPMGDELNTLDGQLGDGDLGVTLVNGFNNLSGIATDLPADLGMAMFQCAKSITAVSGSSFGTLMATALMAAAKPVKGKTQVEWSEMPALLQAAQDAMIARGGASLGDKTMLDSMDAIIAACQDVDDPDKLHQAALGAAKTALGTYRDKPNKIGRARVYADKSIGLDDPGMVAVLRLIERLKTGA